MRELGKRSIDSILLEGGGALNWSALQSGIVQSVQAYIAPKLFGGHGKTPVGGAGVATPDAAFFLSPPCVTQLGKDILLESEVVPCSQES
jgi:diaminohydroxyphosphoribosylaminopyrimidine deaminase/5-amino-6-(5-phosphoribosylamino)uracil reductase